MLQTEYIRNLNCNYERILLDKKPEENKYQYCILSRGGIRGLLPCSLRYINGAAYLYYDITSTQNVAQLYQGRCITKDWMKAFLWSMQQVKQELGRFLLDDRNVVWHPEQIFQDLEKNEFYFLYIPYYEGECGFQKLIEYWVEKIDYEDEALVEFVYRTHEQFELLGSVYLLEQIFEDEAILDKPKENYNSLNEISGTAEGVEVPVAFPAEKEQEKMGEYMAKIEEREKEQEYDEKQTKKGIRYLWEGRRKKQKEERLKYRQDAEQIMEGHVACEETVYEQEEYGRTIFLGEKEEIVERSHHLYTMDGHTVVEITHFPFVIGKRKEESDYSINDNSVSRIHARILKEDEKIYIEDLNSTNGTYKNGLRMQPYEKRILEKEDEIRLGKVSFIYR